MSVNQFNIQIMKKIKIDKIQISDMSPDEKMNVNGGDNAQNQQDVVWTVTVVTVTVTARTMDGWPGCLSTTCLSKNPGTQDSCGLCTTHQHC